MSAPTLHLHTPLNAPRPDAAGLGASRVSPRAAARLLQPQVALLLLYVGEVVTATLQRGVFSHAHTTFPIFRQSFYHLVAGRDLYASYPAEQGAQAFDLFKYSPTAALFFAPFAWPALPWGLFFWNAVNAAVIVIAVRRVLSRRRALMALVIIAPATFNALQSSSSNALIAGVLVLSWWALESGRTLTGATAIAAGTLVKLFPIVGAAFAIGRTRPSRFAAYLALSFLALVALPLIVTSPDTLLRQYASWRAVLMADAGDLSFGMSVMRVLRASFRMDFANWPLQVAGTLVLLFPHVWRRRSAPGPRFRRRFLCSVLVYAVIFNHQAEHASYVIASAGLAIWYVTEPRTLWRSVLLLLCMAGLDTIPYLLVWLSMQRDLLIDDERRSDTPFRAAEILGHSSVVARIPSIAGRSERHPRAPDDSSRSVGEPPTPRRSRHAADIRAGDHVYVSRNGTHHYFSGDRTVKAYRFLLVIAALVLTVPAYAQAVKVKETAPGLLKRAKVTPEAATATARSLVPKGKIVSAEIEEEDGKLLYSFDIKTAGKSGIDEVNVDAISGKGSVQHESPQDEAKEKAADMKKKP